MSQNVTFSCGFWENFFALLENSGPFITTLFNIFYQFRSVFASKSVIITFIYIYFYYLQYYLSNIIIIIYVFCNFF